MKVRRSALKDLVLVATRDGEGANGPTYLPARTVECSVDETRRLVRDSNGDEAVSEATLTLHPRARVRATGGEVIGHVDPLETFTPESTVVLARGRTSRVLGARALTIRGYVTAVEVTCA